MIREKIYSTEQQIKTALFDAKLNAEDIGLTLLVGGSTRIPLVSKFLDETFGIVPQAAVDPDLAVVRGAAIQAGVLSGVLNENAIVLTDICPYSLSTDALVGYGFIDEELICDIIIEKNTTLPAAASKIYSTSHDYQTKVHITAYQGESLDPDENYLLNCFELSGIPKAKMGKEKINLRFEYDLNGILTVQAEIVSTGKSATVTVNTSQMGRNLDLSKWKDAPDARKYRQIIQKAERLVKVHNNDAACDVEAAADELKKALVMSWDSAIIERLKNKLADTIDDLNEENEE
jgi:molecular chaperone DnaK